MHCKRSNGSNRAFFQTVEQAEAFRSEHPDEYGEDEIRFCTRCGFYHLSHPTWIKHFEVPAEKMRAN